MTPEEAATLETIVESIDDAGGRITGTEVDHVAVGGVASAMKQVMGGEPMTRPVFTLEIAAEPSEVLDEDAGRDEHTSAEDAVTVDAETAVTCLRELEILVDETEDPKNEYGDPMSPLARARSRIVALDDVDDETQREVLDVIDEVGEATGAETSPIDPLQDDIFQAKTDLEETLAAGDGGGEGPNDGCGASVQHEHAGVEVPLDEDPADEGGEQQ
jgi:hypothetical protein